MILDDYFPEEEIGKEEVKSKIQISNRLSGCNLKENIYGTLVYTPQLKNNKLIEDEEKKFINKRIFYKNENKQIGYIEVFQLPLLKYAHQTNKKISFLFEPQGFDDEIININKCFGFRYYDKQNKYCTLLKANDNDEDNYFFLEKLDTTENSKYYNENLDCFQIIYEAIFSKYENKQKKYSDSNFDFQTITESPIYEILGFNYACQLKSTQKYKFHKLHTIDVTKDYDFTSHIEKIDDKTILNIMPILFDGHISILFFIDINLHRFFILSDPSHIHSRPEHSDYLIFPEKIRKRLKTIPERKLQKFNSCSFWYYFQNLTLLNYKSEIQSRKYIDTIDFHSSTKNSSFFMDCIRYYEFIMGFNMNLIEISPNIPINEPLSDYFYYEEKDERFAKYFPNKIKIHKFCFLNQIVDFTTLIRLRSGQNIAFKPVIKELIYFRNLNEEFTDLILQLDDNINFFDICKKENEHLQTLSNFLIEANILRNKFVEKANSYATELVKVNNSKGLLEIDHESKNTKLSELYSSIQKIVDEFKNLKNNVEIEVELYPMNITEKVLFPIIGRLYNSK